MSHPPDRSPGSAPQARIFLAREHAPALIVVFLLTLAYALYFGWLSLEEYWSYEMHALDMGNMGQAAWNTLHGHPFRFTNMRLPYAIEAWRTTTRLSFHVEAIFPLLSLVYVIYPHPESLLVLQTLALALGAFAVFFLALEALGSALLGVVFAVSYLLFPTLEALNLYEFHPVALATPLLLLAFLFAWRRRYGPFFLCCCLAMGTKEEIGLIVAMFGLYVALVNGDRRPGLITAGVGAAWSLVAVFVIERHYRQPGTVTYFHNRYGYLGHGVRGAIHTVLHDPGAITHVLFIWPKLMYLVRLLFPTGFLALLAPHAVALGAPTLALNLLSEDFHMYSGVGDNSAELVAVVMIGGILGARYLLRLLGRWWPARYVALPLAAYVLIAALWNQRIDGFTPVGAMFEPPRIGDHQHLADRFVAVIPPGVPVSTQDQLDPHLSSRRYLYPLEDTGRQPPLAPANFILLDVSAPTYPLPSYQIHDRAMSLLEMPGWGVAAARDGLILITKGAKSRSIPPAFYTYAYAGAEPVKHRLQGEAAGLEILGYDVHRTDLANHSVPNLAYEIYLRKAGPVHADVQPVVFETMGGRLIGCVHQPLGLAWLPTSHWGTQRTYVVRMDVLETRADSPGTARLSMDIVPMSRDPQPSCGDLWSHHGRLWSVGSLDVRF